MNPEPPEPERLPTGTVPRDRPGAAWWRYSRPEGFEPEPVPDASAPSSHTTATVTPPLPDGGSFGAPGTPASSGPSKLLGLGAAIADPSPMPFVVLAFVAAAGALLAGRGTDTGILARVSVCALGLAAAAAFARFVQTRHPEEPWIGRFIVWGMVVKLLATAGRYWAFLGSGERSDASEYGEYGLHYLHGSAEPLEDLRKTNFIRHVTAKVYVLIGPDLIAAFFIFSIIAFFGAYLLYRAAAEGVPSLNRKWYCAFMFFAPSLAFWPSSVGKEAIMLAGLGLAALGTVKVLSGKLLQGLCIALPGGWLMWVVRPHLLAFATVSAAAALFVRRGAGQVHQKATLARPIGLLVLGLLGVFAMSQAAEFLGMDDFSLSSIEEELTVQSQHTNQGDSSFKTEEETAQVSITPLSVPQGAVTVLLRPFPWEVENSSQIIACVESAAFAWFIVWRFRSVVASLRQIRGAPYLFYCWVMLSFYAVSFASFSNMGLLVRQRSLILPAFFVLLCVELRAEDEAPVEPVAKSPLARGVSA